MRPWPQRYRVRLRLRSREEVDTTVVTHMDQLKAVAIAVSRHSRGNEDPEREPYEVTVEDLGPVPRGPDGAMQIDGGDIVDRMEF